MKNLQHLAHFTLICVMLIGCKQDQETNSNNRSNEKLTEDFDLAFYDGMRDTVTLANLEERIEKNRQQLAEDSTLLTVLASQANAYDLLFDETGNIDYLGKSVRFRESAVNSAALNRESYLRALAASYVKQHRFKEADSIANAALEISEAYQNKLVAFDVAMELGDYERAEMLLGEIKNTKEPNYLIRAAKWNDYKGNLSATIDMMEQNLDRAEKRGNKTLLLWAQTNLADYYGHDGQLERSYNLNRSALETDPTSSYARKSIAWIAYSADDEPKKALDILDNLYKDKKSPDYLLLMAEINEYIGNEEEARQLEKQFISEVSQPTYRDMYNGYLIELYANGSPSEKQKAVDLAKKEIKNRATPETYDLLAYAYLNNGQTQKALETVKKYVEGKTYEPVAQLHMAQIYKANNQMEKAEELKDELMEADFELGPVVYEEVKQL